jgi:hypothetical protein
LVGFCVPALGLPQTSQTHPSPEFQRLRLLMASNVKGLTKAGFGFALEG